MPDSYFLSTNFILIHIKTYTCNQFCEELNKTNKQNSAHNCIQEVTKSFYTSLDKPAL